MSFFGIGTGASKTTRKPGSGINLGGIAGALSPAIGGFFNAMSRQQDERYTQNMARFNQELMQENARFMNDMNLQYWKDTGAVGQMEQLKKAGLNPGLIYGQGGPGGQTLGMSAPSSGAGNPNASIMGIGLEFAQMTKQMELLNAEKENIQADTEQKKAVTENTGLRSEEQNLINDLREATNKADKEEAFNKYRLELGKHNANERYRDTGGLNEGKGDLFEQAGKADLESQSLANLTQKATEGLQKATASNLLSNDELVRLQTDLLSAQLGVIESDAFKKLPKGLQGILMMIVKKLGGI